MINKNRTLLDVELYELTSSEIGELRKETGHDRYFDREVLPKYCVRNDGKHGIDYADYYLQWVEAGDDKHILFDATTSDKLLSEEISNGGLDSLLKGFDMKNILQTFRKHKLESRYRTLPTSEYLIIDLIYRGSGEDVELDVEVVGKLNLDKVED